MPIAADPPVGGESHAASAVHASTPFQLHVIDGIMCVFLLEQSNGKVCIRNKASTNGGWFGDPTPIGTDTSIHFNALQIFTCMPTA